MTRVEDEEDEEIPAGCACCLTVLIVPVFLFVVLPFLALLFG